MLAEWRLAYLTAQTIIGKLGQEQGTAPLNSGAKALFFVGDWLAKVNEI